MNVYFCNMSRYYPPEKIERFVTRFKQYFPFRCIGHSVEQRPIYAITVGQGPIKVLGWSQMHGNETSTTRALLRFLTDLAAGRTFSFLDQITLQLILQLNPDGALRFQRLNAVNVDLNRDAKALTQPESQALATVFTDFAPDFALNLHGQRTIFAAGDGGQPATLSFLSPAADAQRSLPKQRQDAMQLIADICARLPPETQHCIGRYDDSFNPNCVGDHFTAAGVPTVLFEAGHYPEDYQRNITTAWTHRAFLACCEAIASKSYTKRDIAAYQALPENAKSYVDILIKNARVWDNGRLYEGQEVAIQYQEAVVEGKIQLTPTYHAYGIDLNLQGHLEMVKLPDESEQTIPFEVGESVIFLKNITFD